MSYRMRGHILHALVMGPGRVEGKGVKTETPKGVRLTFLVKGSGITAGFDFVFPPSITGVGMGWFLCRVCSIRMDCTHSYSILIAMP